MDDLCRAVGFVSLTTYADSLVPVEGFLERRLRAGPLGRLSDDLIAKVCSFLDPTRILVLVASGAPPVRTSVLCERHSQGSRFEYGPLNCGGFSESVLKTTVLITVGLKIEATHTGRFGTEGLSFVNEDHDLLGKTIFKLKLRKLWMPCTCEWDIRWQSRHSHRCPMCGRTPEKGCRSVKDLQRRLIRDL